jgi:hypothetical protein
LPVESTSPKFVKESGDIKVTHQKMASDRLHLYQVSANNPKAPILVYGEYLGHHPENPGDDQASRRLHAWQPRDLLGRATSKMEAALRDKVELVETVDDWGSRQSEVSRSSLGIDCQ